MFELDLVKLKNALNFLLEINGYWLFDKGRICALHDQKYVFSVLEEPKVRVKERVLNDASVFVQLLKSKTIVKLKVSPEAGYVIARRPYEYMPKIPVVENEDWLKETARYYRNLLKLDYSEDVWKDDYGGEHELETFKIDNVELSDMLGMVGLSENLEITTGKKLTLTNKRTGEIIRHPKISTDKNVKLLLSKEGQNYLAKALIGEKSEITIANNAIILVKNACKTMIAGRLE